MKRTGLARKAWTHEPTVRREDRPTAAIARLSVVPNYGGGTTGPAPNTVPKRNPALLEMARNRPCLLLIPGCCNHRLDTTVAAHSNLSIHGKGGARKAEDFYTVAACFACHTWLDTGKAAFLRKEAAFMDGHARQVMAWQNIAAASDEPERFRKAARWALRELKEAA